MPATPQPTPKKLTAAEYLEIERKAPYKSEFYDGVMYPVYPGQERGTAGASRPHNEVNENLSAEFGARLKGTGGRTYSRDLRVRVDPAGPYCYPDLVIVCGPKEFAADAPDVLLNPTVIVEVLSDSTEGYDRRFKFRQYQRLPSFQEYVLVAQDEPFVERFVRQPDGSWVPTPPAVGPDAVLTLAAVPVSVPLADIYAGVTFPDAPGRPPG